MPAVHVDPRKVHAFETADAFEAWLRRHHARESEVWIQLHKKASGLPSISPKEAIDVALCWGWIDAVRKALDATSYLQRYTPRTPKSIWSRINVANVERLVREGRMTEHGLRQVELAKADGRWDRAYASGKDMVLPEDLLAAIEAEPKAKAMLARLSAQNRFALAFRLHQLKTEAGRKKRVAAFVEMLKRGETPHPQAR
ncbi:YdeI/OmpD-associated family protein [Ramlibacter pallidus]|uniref:YdeI/OmpD-associated family protein n=1 Tax=Ramlibacter pallidus TaxID=2780087 RepID=A0ABR9S6E5_9BURK|nr:YdeI/OmpD-associated family protein [Ramlibacter pallidus]MBE7369014.1 YdeI/OmpD-associated family protein [Ramlibacter pallidus]